MTRISIVVPTLNEEGRILQRIHELGRLGLREVIVVDGGSSDRTVVVARSAGARVLLAPRGRANQMNRGADAATGDVLLFLHADVRLPDDAVDRIAEALADPGVVGGAFRTRTVRDGHPARLGSLLPLADFRSHYTRTPYGDQAIFARRSAFCAVGGFPPQPLFEDLELSQRLWRVGRMKMVRSKVEVSGRRFLTWPLATAMAMWCFPLLYRWGVSPWVLARWYAHAR
jgi:rSAM/selenodomain-associated transferase 2